VPLVAAVDVVELVDALVVANVVVPLADVEVVPVVPVGADVVAEVVAVLPLVDAEVVAPVVAVDEVVPVVVEVVVLAVLPVVLVVVAVVPLVVVAVELLPVVDALLVAEEVEEAGGGEGGEKGAQERVGEGCVCPAVHCQACPVRPTSPRPVLQRTFADAEFGKLIAISPCPAVWNTISRSGVESMLPIEPAPSTPSHPYEPSVQREEHGI